MTEDEMVKWHQQLSTGLSKQTCVLSKLRELMMDREAWHTVIHGNAKSQRRLSD